MKMKQFKAGIFCSSVTHIEIIYYEILVAATPDPSWNHWESEGIFFKKTKNGTYLDLPGDGVSFLQFADDVHPVRDVHVHSRVHLRHAKQTRAEYISVSLLYAFW